MVYGGSIFPLRTENTWLATDIFPHMYWQVCQPQCTAGVHAAKFHGAAWPEVYTPTATAEVRPVPRSESTSSYSLSGAAMPLGSPQSNNETSVWRSGLALDGTSLS